VPGNSIPILARINESTALWIAVHILPTCDRMERESAHSYLREIQGDLR
jgi:hypothetical protein